MFFVLSKILSYFIFPLTLICVGLFAFWLLSRKRSRPLWGLFWLAYGLLWLCSTPFFADLLLWPLEGPYENIPPPQKADIILVLGGMLDLSRSQPGRLEFLDSADRFVQALHLARQFPDALLVFSGGTGDLFHQEKKEALLLQAEAQAQGIPAERIRLEAQSRNTYENAQETKHLLQRFGGQHVVVVTSAFHMRRALGCLRKAGVSAWPYPVDFRSHPQQRSFWDYIPSAFALPATTLAVREYVGLLMYRLKGYL